MVKITSSLYIISIFLLITLSFYSYIEFNGFYPIISKLRHDPEKYFDKRLEICGHAVKLAPEGIIMSSGSEVIEVRYDNPRFPKFGNMCISGIYKREGYILGEIIRYNDYLFIKYILSFISLFYLAFIFRKEWKLTRDGFVPRRI